MEEKMSRPLVIIEYKASTPMGEGMSGCESLVKRVKDKDTIMISYDMKYVLSSVVFTEKFERLKRGIRETIVKYVMDSVSTGEFLKGEKLSEYILRVVLFSYHFDKNGVVSKNDLYVSWTESCHIDNFKE